MEKQKEKLERERYAVSDAYQQEVKKNARIAQNQDEYRKREDELRQESERLDAEIKVLDRKLQRLSEGSAGLKISFVRWRRRVMSSLKTPGASWWKG